jgi:hypothetical protein
MISDYPDFDPAPEAAWREQHAALFALIADSTEKLAAAQTSLAGLQARRAAHVNAEARGESVATDAHRTIQDEIRAVELDLLHVTELLKRRNSMLAEHDKTGMAARAKAHRPRVIHALRELAAAHVEKHEASAALHRAGQRDFAARQAINLAWGAGWPVPPSLKPSPGAIHVKMELPPACGENTLRRIFGETAVEAFGEAEAMSVAPAAA